MKHFIFLTILLFAASLAFTACGSDVGGSDVGDIEVAFKSAVQIGGTSGTADSTALMLTFDIDPTTLTAEDITVIGATKGKLTPKGTTRTLAISGITVANGEMVYVTITSPAGYSITDSTLPVVVYRNTGEYIGYIGVLKYVPGGSFQRDDNPANISTVTAFRMSEKEITRAQFMEVTGTDPSDTTYSTGTDDPVQNVSWYAALVFCNKLSMLEGLVPVYIIYDSTDPASWGEVPTSQNKYWDAVLANWSANGYRLPTEMEWMWAAMGADIANPGEVNTTGYKKAFAGSTGSNIIDDYVWYKYNSKSTAHPVGTKLANELGLYDMSGNVWEWCWDIYASYPTGELKDYWGAASGAYRVKRGGSWYFNASFATVANRYYISLPNVLISFGFRVVRP